MSKQDWTFRDYLEEIFYISEIPGMKQKHAEMISEMWDKFPLECEAIGLTDRARLENR